MLQIFWLLIACFFICTQAKPALGQDNPYLSPLREITLPAYQRQALDADTPFSAMILDSSNGIWILGSQHLWRWSLLDAQLQRFHLNTKNPSKERGNYRHLTTDSRSLFFTSPNALYRMELDPMRMIRLPIPNESATTLDLGLAGDKLYWLTTKGSYLVDPGLDRLMLSVDSTFNNNDHSWFDPKLQVQWIGRDDALFATANRDGKIRTRLIHRTNAAIKGIQATAPEVFAYTSNTVLRFHRNGDLLQAIPVSSDRRIQAAEFRAGMHSYLFSDGLLERYNLQSESRRQYVIPADTSEASSVMVSSTSVVALILNQSPRVFHLLDVD